MNDLAFSPIEKTISFYTRNDFAILNHLLIGDLDGLWKYALLAYRDNQGIIDEYERGVRTIDSDYDIKWLNSLKERQIDGLDGGSKASILKTARDDISNILRAMSPTRKDLLLYRTAWIDPEYTAESSFAYSREYRNMALTADGSMEIKTISSFSLTPYREEEDVGSDFYRYELYVPKGGSILPLDQFVCHNEPGEVLLPPMRCSVTGFRGSENKRCRGVIALVFSEPLPYRE